MRPTNLEDLVKEAEKEAEREIKERAEAMNSETEYKPDIKVNLMSGKIEGKGKEKCII